MSDIKGANGQVIFSYDYDATKHIKSFLEERRDFFGQPYVRVPDSRLRSIVDAYFSQPKTRTFKVTPEQRRYLGIYRQVPRHTLKLGIRAKKQ